jgi:hypothetical protein
MCGVIDRNDIEKRRGGRVRMVLKTTIATRRDGHWQTTTNQQTHLEGIISGEMNIKEKDPTRIWRILWSHDRRLPMKHIVTDGPGRAIGRRILAQIDQFLFSISHRQK